MLPRITDEGLWLMRKPDTNSKDVFKFDFHITVGFSAWPVGWEMAVLWFYLD